MPDAGNRRKIVVKNLGGVRRDIDPTAVPPNEFITLTGVFVSPRGLERCNAWDTSSSTSLGTESQKGSLAPLVNTDVGSSDNFQTSVWAAKLDATGFEGLSYRFTYPSSTVQFNWYSYQTSLVITSPLQITFASATAGTITTTTATIDGTVYDYDLRYTYGIRVGDRLQNLTGAQNGTVTAVTKTTVTLAVGSTFTAATFSIVIYRGWRALSADYPTAGYMDWAPLRVGFVYAGQTMPLGTNISDPYTATESTENEIYDLAPIGRTAATYPYVPLTVGVANSTLHFWSAYTVASFKNWVFIGNTIEDQSLYPAQTDNSFANRIRWSSPTNSADWTNPLSFLDLPAAYGGIVKLVPTGQFLYCFCARVVLYGSQTGDPNTPVAFNLVDSVQTGPQVPTHVAQLNNDVYFVGVDGVYHIRGVEARLISDPIVSSVVERSPVDSTKVSFVLSVDARRNRLLLYSSKTTSVWAMDLKTGGWSEPYPWRTYRLLNVAGGRTAQAATTHINMGIMYDATQTASTFYLRGEYDEATVPTAAGEVGVTIITGDIGGQQPEQIKEFFGLWLTIQESISPSAAARTVSIVYTVALSTDHGATFIQVPSPLYILPGKREGYVTFKRISNHLRIKLTSSTLVAPYTLVSYTVDVKGMQAAESLLTQGINNANV